MENIEDLNQFLMDRKNPDYQGYKINENEISKYSGNAENISRYSKFNAIKDRNGQAVYITDDDLKGAFSPLQFIYKCGYNSKELEGGSIQAHLNVHADVFQKFYEINHRYPTRIAEIGFNTGVSAWNFLDKMSKHADDQFDMVSFDLGYHHYSFYAKYFIDCFYPINHTLITGSSVNTIPNFHEMNPDYQFDLIFIDGDHTFFGAFNDIVNCKSISNRETMIIVDNVVPHRGVGREVYLALLQCLKDDFIIHLKSYEIDIENEEYHDGCSLIQYNFTEKKYDSTIDYKKMERKVFTYSINKILNNQNITMDQYKSLYSLIQSNLNEISDFTLSKINKKHIPYYNNRFGLKLSPIYRNRSVQRSSPNVRSSPTFRSSPRNKY